MTVPAPHHHTFHLTAPRKKHEENSRRGILEARAGGFEWWDGDHRHDAEGNSWNTHWDMPLLRDGFRDPRRQVGLFSKVSRMDPAVVQRLRTKDGYRIRDSVDEVLYALEHGLGNEFDVKDSRFTVAFFATMRRAVIHHGFDPARVWVKGYPRFHRSIAAAHFAGFPTILLTHGDRVSASYQEFSDYHRGPVTWV